MKLNLNLTDAQVNELRQVLESYKSTKELQVAVKTAIVKARTKQELKVIKSEVTN